MYVRRLSQMLLKGLVTLCLLFAANASALPADYVYFRNVVQHADGSLCTHTPPLTSFVCFLNRNESKILIENAPRWRTTGGPN
ncbi:MAG: hypothetical protein AABZ61_02560, partial [Bacteroidota bacterium]